MSALALTEHGNSSSWVQLEKHCRRREIRPIFGLEAYLASENEPRKFHMILLAKDEEGLRNLNRIITESWKTLGSTSKSKFPTVHFPVLKRFNRGIVALSGCASGPLACILLGGKHMGPERLEFTERNLQQARRCIEQFQAVLGERYFLEVQRFPALKRTCVLNPALEKLSQTTGSPLVGTADVHYPMPDENDMQRILHAAHRGGKSVDAADAEWEYDILLTYPESDREIYRDLVATGLSGPAAKSAVINTEKIAALCNVELPKAPPPSYIINPERDWEPWT